MEIQTPALIVMKFCTHNFDPQYWSWRLIIDEASEVVIVLRKDIQIMSLVVRLSNTLYTR